MTRAFPCLICNRQFSVRAALRSHHLLTHVPKAVRSIRVEETAGGPVLVHAPTWPLGSLLCFTLAARHG